MKRFEIRLIPVVSATTFDADKLLPAVNNCHRDTEPDEPQPATPYYNLAILEDMHLLATLDMLHNALAAASAPLVDALLLLKVRALCGERVLTSAPGRPGSHCVMARSTATV